MFDELKIRFNEPVYHAKAYEQWGRKLPPDFFDRSEEARRLLSSLRSPQSHQSAVVIGERRSGKTSMLKFLCKRLQDDGFVTIEAPAGSIRSEQEFYEELLGELGLAFPHLLTNLQPKTVPLSERVLQAIEAVSLGKQEERRHNPVPILISIDELDAMISQALMPSSDKQGIVNFLQDIVQQKRLPVKLLFSITHQHVRDVHLAESPLYSESVSAFMTPFPETDALAMVKAMLKEPERWREASDLMMWEEFCSLSGCWPYYMKLLISYLARTKPESKTMWLQDASERALKDDQLYMTLANFYERHLDEDERVVLLWMVAQGGKLETVMLQTADESLLQAAERLTARSYLTKENDHYTFRVGILQRWFARWPEFNVEWRKHRKLVKARESV